MSRFPLLTCCFQSTLVSLQSISTSCSSTYCNGHIYTRKWSGLQPWDQVALQKSVCLSLPPWTFSPKIRIVSSCHLSHASPSPKPHRLYLVHSVFFTRFSISTIAYIIFFTHVFFLLSLTWMSALWTNFKSLCEFWQKRNSCRPPERKDFCHLKMLFPQPGSQQRLGCFGWSFKTIKGRPLANKIQSQNVV